MMPYYPARDGHPSMFTLDDNASAATEEPIRDHSIFAGDRRSCVAISKSSSPAIGRPPCPGLGNSDSE